jgi:hypothetical protein
MAKRIVRGSIVVLCAFVALSAIPSAFLVVPALPAEWLRWGPFTDYTIPAIALGAVGVVAATTAVAVVSVPQLGALAAIGTGIAMAAFEVVEVFIVGFALALYPDMFQSWLQPIYFAVGIAIALLGVALYRERGPRHTLAA